MFYGVCNLVLSSRTIDFFDVYYGESADQQIYTFPQNLKYCYVCFVADGNDITYTGTGTKTTILSNGSATRIDLITTIQTNETVKAPALTFGSARRTIMFFMGKK